jgi:hypothetical protein
MNKLLKIAVGAAALTALTVSMASAGLNAGATGKLLWIGSNNKSTNLRDNVTCTPTIGFATTGLKNMKGADVQLIMNGVLGSVPPSWQWWSSPDGSSLGCAAAASATTYFRGFSSTGVGAAADSIYNAWTGVPGQAGSQDGAEYYQYTGDPCVTPHGVAVIWFSASGTNGVAKVASKTYGLFKLSIDQNSGCPGDCSDPAGVCILVNYRLPCNDPANPRGAKFVLVGSDNNTDDCVVPAGLTYLTWNANNNPACPGVTPAATSSWGSLKHMYH